MKALANAGENSRRVAALSPRQGSITRMGKGWVLRPLCAGGRASGRGIGSGSGPAFPQFNRGVVGLAGLEPAASSLSEMDGRALCYPAFSLVVLLRKSYKDGVNRCPPPSVRRYVAGSGLGHPPGYQWPSICHGPGGQRMRSRSSSLRRPVGADRRRWRGSALANWRWAHAS